MMSMFLDYHYLYLQILFLKTPCVFLFVEFLLVLVDSL